MKWSNYAKIRLVLVVFVAALVLGNGSANADFTFGEPVNLGPTVNSSSSDWPPSISADGLSLFFCSNRPGGYGNRDIWVSTRPTIYEPWGTPENLGPTVNSSEKEALPSISSDGLSLFFESTRPGGYGNHDLWVTTRPTVSDPWGTPVNLGPTVNTSAQDATPCISEDGLSLFFESTRSGGYGNFDILVTTRTTPDADWSAPVNLGATVNSSSWDGLPRISADGLALFFHSDRPGGYGADDIWVTTRKTKDDPWEEPVNLGPTVNSGSEAPGSISADGQLLFFDSLQPGGYGGGDMWQAPIIPIVDFNGDEFVDTNDLLIMIDLWGTDDSICDIGPMPWGDGIVDNADLEVLMSYWGQKVDDPTFIAHWKLDETEGTIAYNSAVANDADVFGGAIWQPQSGMIDGALQLDGIDDYVSTPFTLNPAFGPFSVFAWIEGGVPGQVILSQADGVDWLLADSSDGCLMTDLGAIGGRQGQPPLISSALITDGDWHRIGFVWDGSGRHLYVDGVEVASDTPLSGLESAERGLYLGADNNLAPSTFFSGLIDDVRIYSRVITP